MTYMPRTVLFLFTAAACLMAQDQTATTPPPAIPDLIKTGQASYMRGDYEAARQSFQQAWEIARMGPMDDPVRYDILKRLVSARAAAGEFADADDVLLSVGFARAMKDFDKALGVMSRVLSLHRMAAGLESIAIADDLSRVGQIYAEKGNKEAAISFLHYISWYKCRRRV